MKHFFDICVLILQTLTYHLPLAENNTRCELVNDILNVGGKLSDRIVLSLSIKIDLFLKLKN